MTQTPESTPEPGLREVRYQRSHGVGFVIRDLYAFLAVHADGDEGVVAAYLGGNWLPLVAADPVRLDQLRPIAQQTARETGVTIRLVRFTQREEVETISP